MRFILDWAEVWAVFIPLTVLLMGKRQPGPNRPVVLYLYCALGINLLSNLIWKVDLFTYDGQSYNGFLYNIHSIVSFLFFDQYFNGLKMRTNRVFSRLVRISFGAFVIINFTFYEKFYDPQSPLSSLLLSVECVLLLTLCLQYYFYKLNSDEPNKSGQPDFWIVTGLSIYVVINFFIFLLYDAISRRSARFAINLWDVHNVSYVLFNIFIARAFYQSKYGRD